MCGGLDDGRPDAEVAGESRERNRNVRASDHHEACGRKND